MPTVKPKFPQISAAQVRSHLANVRQALDKASRGGAIDMDTLLDEAERSSDPAVKKSYHCIASHLPTGVPFKDAEGNKRLTGVPRTLEGQQARDVFEAVERAASRVDQLLGADRILDQAEAAALPKTSVDLGTDLALAALATEIDPHEERLRQWCWKVQESASGLDARKWIDEETRHMARHAQSDAGREALFWSLMAAPYEPGYTFVPPREQEKRLREAEGSGLGRVPVVGWFVKRAEGHLDDAEVGRLLGTNDLAALAAEKKSLFERNAGPHEAWLRGAGLSDLEQRKDPDFKKPY